MSGFPQANARKPAPRLPLRPVMPGNPRPAWLPGHMPMKISNSEEVSR